ncbi:proline dehydrogenase [Synchytrium endobioticum]|uniref:Proline dehydrogenase n=1 Tax=Synchytrium endobioticum TaxID=286115 RepID=A0A507DMQ5_9FUNG|nr:hypothetical protein SeMB42_g01363 [Synchytrium endobioticum]TPX52517.1 proline dehydrogenase [Synchytrium endobioticum]
MRFITHGSAKSSSRTGIFERIVNSNRNIILLSGGVILTAAGFTGHQGPTPYPSVTSSNDRTDLLLSEPQRPYSSKSMTDILRSLLVFKLCQLTPLVSLTPYILKYSEALNIDQPIHAIIRHTFFSHFCGGEDINEVVKTMSAFHHMGIRCILDYAIEADTDAPLASPDEAGLYAANIADTLMQSIDVAKLFPGSLIAVKVTALLPPRTLADWSGILCKVDSCISSSSTGDGVITKEQLIYGLQAAGATLDEASTIYNAASELSDNRVDRISLSQVLSVWHPQGKIVLSRLAKLGDYSTVVDNALEEMKSVCFYARDCHVGILIDAEQTYFQPAVSEQAFL